MSPSDPFPSSEFDKWSETYDLSVNNDLFPFTGYKILLGKMTSLASIKPDLRVLDLGTGTGNLALPFASAGCEVWCTDFSASMLKKAQQKIPGAHFVMNDLRGEWPLELIRPFDRIISAYVFHHFDLDQKIAILGNLRTILAPGGRIIIGDISYPSEDMLETSKLEEGDNWEDEYYWLATEAIPALEALGFNVNYEQVSPCAGIYVLSR